MNEPTWVKGDDVTYSHKRWRTRRLHPELGTCERCNQKPAILRHHVDGNPDNNAPANIMRVCGRCHLILHGNLPVVGGGPHPPKKPASPCIECGRPYKPLRKGKCNACYKHERYWAAREV